MQFQSQNADKNIRRLKLIITFYFLWKRQSIVFHVTLHEELHRAYRIKLTFEEVFWLKYSKTLSQCFSEVKHEAILSLQLTYSHPLTSLINSHFAITLEYKIIVC